MAERAGAIPSNLSIGAGQAIRRNAGDTAFEAFTPTAGSGLTIGDAVTGGGANRVLYEDGSQNLAASANFTFTSSMFTVEPSNSCYIGGSDAADDVSVLRVRRRDVPTRWVDVVPSKGGVSSTIKSWADLYFEPTGDLHLNPTAGRVFTINGSYTEGFSGGVWINLPTSGPSGIGTGGAGSNPMLAYCASGAQWFTDSLAGDNAIRNTGGKLLFGNSSGASAMSLGGDNIGIGVYTAAAKTHIQHTAEQVRIGYDASNYAKITVASNGAVTIDAVGSGASFTFSDRVDCANFRVVATAGDIASPADGDIWYNSVTNKFRKRENGATSNLDTTGGGGGLSDGDYSDITVSGSATVFTIDNDVVTYAKMQNVSATDKLLGRSTAGSGDVEEIACTAFGRSLIDDADNTAARSTLGLGSMATQNATAVAITGGTGQFDFRGLSTLDAGLDHALTLASGEDLTANRRLSFILSDANRSLTVSADTTLNGGTHSGTNTGDEPSATDSAEGVVELATTAEVLTGTDTVRAVTPDALAALWEQGSDVASGSTVTLGDGMFFNITGTTTITDIDLTTDKSGRMFALRFDGVLTLTHNATSLILPGGANITTAAGDVAMFVSLGSDNVRCISYQRAGGSGAGYAVTVSAADAATTTDAQTIYFGGTFAVAPSTTAGNHRVYIPKAGIIRSARIWCHAATAGTNESWTIAIRLNNTTDTTVEALASNASYRVWSNNALGITVAAGDYIEIKSTNPTWATNPANVRFGGEIFIETI